ncbi:hypothetical protein BB560_001533 [Smittium megazygosporum]|uniref:3-hydroxyisobutyryl-CoA hydrolase n=1 Tax=Smittium megazygosporum TaxID=133381 RepID=A0A2T9ZHI9_9FUNG|nr:hypothetical protein BB560_001533 [Smittium megazygosporum]
MLSVMFISLIYDTPFSTRDYVVKENLLSEINGILFFIDEYAINHVMASVKKPVVAIIHGITMGGGVGASVHFPFRIATETTLFAMPETLIGLFPDVGASFFLSRLDSQVGTYLGLTGTRISGKDVFYTGIATHYVHSKHLPEIERRLAQAKTSSHDEVNAIIEEFVDKDSGDYKNNTSYTLAPYLDAINRCFGFNTLEEIFEALESETEKKDWARNTLKILKQMSPSSLKITLEMVRRGKNMSIKQCFNMEGHIAAKIIKTNDFNEGVSELLIRKTKNPKFIPPTIYGVSKEEIVEKYFEKTDPMFNIKFRSEVDFYEYPHKKYTLPNEADVMKFVGNSIDVLNSNPKSHVLTAEMIVEHFDRLYNHKAGVKEKVWDIVTRCSSISQNLKPALSKL